MPNQTYRVYRHRPPGPPDAKTQIARINEISQMARATWFGLLAYFTFVGITLLGVEDADFFIPSRQTRLPLVNVDIPTADFFLFAPILGAALFIYLHLQLLKLWDALAAPPPEIAGRPLAEHVMPWLINDLALAIRGKGAAAPRPMSWLSYLVTFALVFAAGPILLGWIWVRYWPSHDERTTLIIGFALALTAVVCLTSLLAAVRRLRFGAGFRRQFLTLA